MQEESASRFPVRTYNGPLESLVGEFIWFVHPDEVLCRCLGTIRAISPVGDMAQVQDWRGVKSFTFLEGPFTRAGVSCRCGANPQ